MSNYPTIDEIHQTYEPIYEVVRFLLEVIKKFDSESDTDSQCPDNLETEVIQKVAKLTVPSLEFDRLRALANQRVEPGPIAAPDDWAVKAVKFWGEHLGMAIRSAYASRRWHRHAQAVVQSWDEKERAEFDNRKNVYLGRKVGDYPLTAFHLRPPAGLSLYCDELKLANDLLCEEEALLISQVQKQTVPPPGDYADKKTGTPLPIDTDETTEDMSKVKLPKSIYKAYHAAKYAELQTGQELTDFEAWSWLKENELEEGTENKYELPALGTFQDYMNRARRKLGEKRNQPRGGRTAQSVKRQSEI